MLKMNRILLPIDFREPSRPLVHQTAAVARHFHSEIVIVHVVTPLSYSAGMLEGNYVPRNVADLKAELIRGAQTSLDRLLAPEFEGLAVKRVLLEGDPAGSIVETAGKEKADLIMMPTHGYGAFRRFLLGSVTAKVLHDSDVPVWTAAHLEEPSTSEFRLRHILCGVDLSAHSSRTVAFADQLAAEFGARLTLVHVTPGMEPYGPGAYNLEPAWQETIITAATTGIAHLQRELRTKAEVIIESGDVPKQLSSVAQRSEADLLVIGRPPIGRLRATGYSIIRESRVPVLSV